MQRARSVEAGEANSALSRTRSLSELEMMDWSDRGSFLIAAGLGGAGCDGVDPSVMARLDFIMERREENSYENMRK